MMKLGVMFIAVSLLLIFSSCSPELPTSTVLAEFAVTSGSNDGTKNNLEEQSDSGKDPYADLHEKYKDDPEKFDQAVYAQHYDIDMDEAEYRFDIMDNAHLLGNALENDHPDVFTGFWIEHEPEFRLVASFTRNGEEILETYRDKYPDLVEITIVKENEYTLDELLQAQGEANHILRELGLFFSSATMEMDNRVEIYVTDSELFYGTLEEAGVELPECVVPVIVYEPLRGVPAGLNPVPSMHFPQVKMRSGSSMAALLTGKLELVDGYLRVGDAIIIWQTDYFLHDNDGIIEVWDRDGNVVGRVGEEIMMGGGSAGTLEWINLMLKEPVPADMEGPFWMQASSGTRLSLNFNSEFFSLQVIDLGEYNVYFLTRKPALDGLTSQEVTLTGSLLASYNDVIIQAPHIRVETKPEENKGTVSYTTFWPDEYQARITDGVFEVLDGEGKVVVRDGEEISIRGKILYGYHEELHDELPGGFFQPYLIVDEIFRGEE